MENIELFDRYINGELSTKEREEFDNRLKSDKDFAADFKVYSMTVIGICSEAEQDNIDFAHAMKGISKEQLRNIIGPRKEIDKPKVIRFKPWIWQAASIAAVVVIAFTVVFNIQKNAGYKVDNAIIASQDQSVDLWRSGGEQINIAALTDSQLKEKLPELVDAYNGAEAGSTERVDNGFTLSMAYLRLHDRDNAKKTLNALISEYRGDEEYAAMVEKWESIIKLIE